MKSLTTKVGILGDVHCEDVTLAAALELFAREYDTPDGLLLLCHGMLHDDMSTLRPDDSGYELHWNKPVNKLVTEKRYRVVVIGHSHRRMVRELDGVTFINAGTLFRDHEPCVLLLDFERGAAQFFDGRGSGEFAPSEPILFRR